MTSYDFAIFLRRTVFFAAFNLLDALILFQGHYIKTQIALIAMYRWVLYTPSHWDLLIFLLFGFFWDAIDDLPFGFNSFLALTIFTMLNTQKRYLQVNHQYMRWIIFFGVLILSNQIDYALHLLIGQQIMLSAKIFMSLLITFSAYPLAFRILQHYDR